GSPAKVWCLSDAVDFFEVGRGWLVESPRVPRSVFEEFRILRRHRRVFGVVDEDSVAPHLQQFRPALAEPHGIRAIDRFRLDLRAALALALPLFDDLWAAIGDDVPRNRMRPAVDDGAEAALLRCLPGNLADFRAGDDLLRRRIHAAECRADGPAPHGAGRAANRKAYNGAN